MIYLTLTPAYGRDYTSAKAAVADWHAGKDFQDALTGQYANKDDIDGGTTVNLRYKRVWGGFTRVAVVRPSK